jgi:hypothetical protein
VGLAPDHDGGHYTARTRGRDSGDPGSTAGPSPLESKEEVERFAGGPPAPPRVTDEVIGVFEWVDGTVIDSIYQVAE